MYCLIQQGKISQFNNLPKSENMTNFSILNDLSEQLTFRSFSIKYVIEGCEHYKINGNWYDIRSGEYLLANTHCEGKIEIESKSQVKGICIDLSLSLMSEAFGSFVMPGNAQPAISPHDFFCGESFLENKYRSHHTQLGSFLNFLGSKLNNDPFQNYYLDNDFYFTLAEHIVQDHQAIIAQLYSINAIKHNTRKELFRKLTRGKDFLENHLGEEITIGKAAEYAMLSEFHFFRLFKKTFGVTPWQFLIQKRLFSAMNLLLTGNYSVTEASIETGFADVHSFSKAFKKHYGLTPSEIAKGKLAEFDK